MSKDVLQTYHRKQARQSRLPAVLSSVKALSFGVCLTLMLPAFSAMAPTDSGEDIRYHSDGGGSIETEGNVRTTTLRENVRIQQGMVTIFGNTASLIQNTQTGELIRVTVAGEPARFTREAPLASETITGSSDTIIYYNEPGATVETLLSVVEFVGYASFTRGGTALECSEIKHVIETAATDSPGPCSGVFAPDETSDDDSAGN